MERQWLNLDQIKAEYASNDYNPELLLQHLLPHVEASPASVPEGYALVPVEPTLEMFNAGDGAFFTAYTGTATSSPDRVYKAMIAAAPTPPVSEDRWQPIETAPKETTQMFVVVAFGAKVGATPYNSDPWCVWHQRGEFVRWPHKFSPTHWMPLPKAPAMQEDKP